MNILFIHCNYPAQFSSLSAALAAQPQHTVYFLTARQDAVSQPIPGVNIECFNDVESNEEIHQSSQVTDRLIRRAHVIQESLLKLRQSGFIPRLVIYHGSNGIGLLLRDVLPLAAIIGYFEWYFTPSCAQLLLDSATLPALAYTSFRNLVTNQEILQSDASVTPTRFQADQFPQPLKNQLNVVFDGIDTSFFCPGKGNERSAALVLEGESGSVRLRENQPLLTYATRGMEPLRGFPEFMRALPGVLAACPDLIVVIGGRDHSVYGCQPLHHGGSWKQSLLDELGEFEGLNRVYFPGLMSYLHYREMLRRSNLHCYFTRPFVTSWSLFEAIACATPLLTNISPATTGLFPFLLADAIDLDEPAEVMAANIMSCLDTGANQREALGLPEQYQLANCQTQWQEVLNQALSQTSCD